MSHIQRDGFNLQLGYKLHGRYVLKECWGGTDNYIIYLGVDEIRGTKVFIKEWFCMRLANRLIGTTQVISKNNREIEVADRVRNFLEEARRLAKFRQNLNLITVTYFFEENGTGYLVWDYEEGETLQNYLRNYVLHWQQALPIVLQVMDALLFLHNNNICHLEICPYNIFLTDYGLVKLMDTYGLRYYDSARHFNTEKKFQDRELYGYAPPEKRAEQGPWTEVYALGATLYRMLSGENVPHAKERIKKDELLSLYTYMPDAPKKLIEIVHKALSLKPEARFQTVEEMQQAMMEVLQTESSEDHQITKKLCAKELMPSMR